MEVDLVAMKVFGYWYSPGHKCTHVLSDAGAIAPVLESPSEVRKQLERVLKSTKGVK